MTNHKNLIISPSGQLYGSENVLLDFLNGSNFSYKIYAPANSLFYIKLKELGYMVYGFKNLKILYLKVFFRMLLFDVNLYLNEAGHISYINFLASILKKRNFVVSVRLVEDCNDKLSLSPKNVHIVTVSKYLKSKIDKYKRASLVYDPYSLSKTIKKRTNLSTPLKLGMVGRIGESKGFDNLFEVLNGFCVSELKNVRILFFGNFNETSSWFLQFKKRLDAYEFLDYCFCGFKENQADIYLNCDIIIHLNKNEPLGRILFEAIDFNKPFMCLGMGGTGELCSRIGLSKYAFSAISDLTLQLKEVIKDPESLDPDYKNARKIISSEFRISDYSVAIEKFLKK